MPLMIVPLSNAGFDLFIRGFCSFLFFGFGHFEGVKWGTVLCALINGWMIGAIAAWMEKKFVFRDALADSRFRRILSL